MMPRSVKVRIPPDTGYVPLLRTTVAGVAAREAFTLEEVDDLRMAVEEAAVLLLRRGDRRLLALDVTVDDTGLEAVLSTPCEVEEPPLEEASFSWMILTALADTVRRDGDDHELRIVLTKARSTDHAHD